MESHKTKNMIFEPKIFYERYLKDYHKHKAFYLKKILENPEKYVELFFDYEISKQEKENFKRTLQADLRQTYFHAIETFFEIFFALNPENKNIFDDEYLLFNLTNAKWQNNYKKIQDIAEGKLQLDFLTKKIQFYEREISIGHFLFYLGIYPNGKFPMKMFDEIDNSIEAIKYGIKLIAQDFTNKEEYNAYKHGLRLIPTSEKLMIAEAKTMKIRFEWDISQSMSFYKKSKNKDELTVVTKLFDTERDYNMTLFCSNLIHHMIFYRKIGFDRERKNPQEQIPITMFGKEPIEKCNKINVDIQDLEYTVKRK